ncbi:hypothetical protein XELAEV_18025069mg [Xenopus laevis]|uniref:GIY-YIG domain-containing protein n=1 Tax=Xenopus laevis TaxID=8355 RepID=A0A974D012_XENLA|nr:hypothetical protein XELAEV_18025069mg [Xenopus laevis]
MASQLFPALPPPLLLHPLHSNAPHTRTDTPEGLTGCCARNRLSCLSIGTGTRVSGKCTCFSCVGCSTGAIYIGETGQKLCTRIKHHRHKINTKSCDTPVGQHFCNQNHSLQDMKVLKLNEERKIYEFKYMELFNTLRQGLNLGSGFMSPYVTC